MVLENLTRDLRRMLKYMLKHTTESFYNPGVSRILVEEDRLVSTDGYTLIVVKRDPSLGKYVGNTLEFPQGIQINQDQTLVEPHGGDFVDFRQVFPTPDNQQYVAHFEAGRLRDILDGFDGPVTFRFFGHEDGLETTKVVISGKVAGEDAVAITVQAEIPTRDHWLPEEIHAGQT